MMNKEAKQERSQIPPDSRRKMFGHSPVRLASSRKLSGKCRLAGGHFGEASLTSGILETMASEFMGILNRIRVSGISTLLLISLGI